MTEIWRAELFWLGAYFLGYCVLHSILASLRCKSWVAHRFSSLMPAYRLLFNLLSVVLLLPLLWLYLRASGPLLWHWSGGLAWFFNGLALLALGCFLSTLRDYDLSLFSGTAQLKSAQLKSAQTRTTAAGDPEQRARFHLGFWHRYIRHPWYSFALVIIWTRSMDEAQLLLSLLATVYFIIGSRLEEGKLVDQFGEAYRRYRRQVPGLLPWPGRCLSVVQARELEASAESS